MVLLVRYEAETEKVWYIYRDILSVCVVLVQTVVIKVIPFAGVSAVGIASIVCHALLRFLRYPAQTLLFSIALGLFVSNLSCEKLLLLLLLFLLLRTHCRH